jgi:hypothetical protein
MLAFIARLFRLEAMVNPNDGHLATIILRMVLMIQSSFDEMQPRQCMHSKHLRQDSLRYPMGSSPLATTSFQ